MDFKNLRLAQLIQKMIPENLVQLDSHHTLVMVVCLLECYGENVRNRIR